MCSCVSNLGLLLSVISGHKIQQHPLQIQYGCEQQVGIQMQDLHSVY